MSRKKKKKIDNLLYKSYREYWGTKECIERSFRLRMLNQNHKLSLTSGELVSVYGLEFMPVWKGACKWAGSCSMTCLEGSGVQQIITKNKNYISCVDKNRLSRQWLMLNEREAFQFKLETEIQDLLYQTKREKRKLCLRLDVLSEYKLRDEYAPKFKDVLFYDYFKEPERIAYKCPPNVKELYSWNEKSGEEQLIHAFTAGKPVAVVLPRAVHKGIFCAFDQEDTGAKVIKYPAFTLVDGDVSDLHAIKQSAQGRLVFSLLSEKVTRKGQKNTAFLRSWQDLFKRYGFNVR